MQLPNITPPSKAQTLALEIQFKFMRAIADDLNKRGIAYRPINQLDPSFAKIEIANVTRDNAEKMAIDTVMMILGHSTNHNVFEFSRVGVAELEGKDQHTMNFYGRWITEDLNAKR